MPVTYCGPGDIWSSTCQVIVIPVNTVGAMGKGLAESVRSTYPIIYKTYRESCRQGRFKVGTFMTFSISDHSRLLLFPTKKSWRAPSKLEWIDDGLKRLAEIYDKRGFESIAFPALGCGEGGLDFESTVKPLIYKYFDGLPIKVEIWLG